MINLMPYRERLQGYFIAAVVLLVLLLISGLMLLVGYPYFQDQQQLTDLARQQQTLEQALYNGAQMAKRQRQLQRETAQLDEIKLLVSKRLQFSRDLILLLSTLPQGIQLRHLTCTQAHCQLQVSAKQLSVFSQAFKQQYQLNRIQHGGCPTCYRATINVKL